eukprot:2327481-Amphidinium_carterae.1
MLTTTLLSKHSSPNSDPPTSENKGGVAHDFPDNPKWFPTRVPRQVPQRDEARTLLVEPFTALTGESYVLSKLK